jgi:predicted RNase H-like nuclease (RuvC/YqgF family)
MTKDEITNRIEELRNEMRHDESLVVQIEYEIEELENKLERIIDHENGDDIIIGDYRDA